MSVFIIAEIGINHNGNLEIAKKLIDLAKSAGCNAVKFQKRDINLVYTKEFLDTYRESPWGTTQRDQKLGLEFGVDQYDVINEYCQNVGIDWFASTWDENSLKFLDRYDLKFNKVASAMLANISHLHSVASHKKYTFISTGMSTLNDISEAVSIFNKYKCPFELMHCVSTYPMKIEDANLRCITTLRENFNCNVGYSGHETGIAISVAAAVLGATSIERHITLDRSMYGSDQAASLEGAGIFQLCRYIRIIEAAMGDGIKRVLPEEIEIANKLRAHFRSSRP
jgi:N-acetylneuraminate synthase